MSGLLVFVSGMFIGAATLIILALSLGAREWTDDTFQKHQGYEPQTEFLQGTGPLRLSR